ncbi:hypothetical protein C6499_00205 [Candidatus Poribacteria bacterium]|nr:MAG: hypothetical protein C6499_00205 [Candidatus Poribacteria bacterium]
MSRREKCVITVCVVSLIACFLWLTSITLAQDETSDAKIIERYKSMLNRNPKEGSTFDRLYQFYLEGAGLDAMVADYQTAAQAKPNDANLQLILGHIHKRLGKDTETVAAYQRAVELAPNAYYPHFTLGQMYATMRRHADAIRELTRAAELSEATRAASPEELMEIYKALGRAHFSRDQVDAAISAWAKIPELDPENIFARIELSDLFREQELYEQAIAQHQAIIELKTEDPYRVCLSHREIGNIHQEKGDYEAAIQSYDAALALTAPGNWLRKDLQHRIIGIYAADGNWEGLITHYQGKLETTPNDPERLGLLAAAYIENQQPDEGIATYQKALELAPTDTGLRLNLIAAFRDAEKFEEAAAAYESLSEQHPDDFGIYRELGELYLQLEDENSAKTTYARMRERNPDDASTYLTLAEIYAGNEWIEDAVAAYQKAISLAPDNLDYIEYFGEFYFRQGNREKTVETWNRIVDADKLSLQGNAENYDRLAKLFDAKDFGTEAVAASRKAVELAPDTYRYREALAKRLMENEDYEDALVEYAEAAKLAPNAFFAEQMGDQQLEIYRRQGVLVARIEALEAELEAPTNAPGDAFGMHKQLAKMYLKLGNITYAIEILLKTKSLQPDDVTVNRWLAEIYTRQGLRDDANAIYTHLIEVDNANAREYYTNIARSHLKVMDFDAATDAAKQAIAHSPRNPEGHQMLAQIAKQIGNYQNAADSLKQAIRLRPEATDIRSELAEIYKLSGNPRQALEQYWRCWELSESVNDKLAFVKSLSEVYYDLGRRGELEEKLKQMAKTDTSSIGPVVALAQIYRDEGDLSSARFQLARALDRTRENQDLLAQLVKVSLDLGDTQDALTYQQRLVKAHPDPNHQRRLGELLFDAGREQEAIQAWTKLMHAKNQPLAAEIKLAALLIRHGLLDEALSVLDRAAEKATGPNAHITLYQLGAALVNMNEFDRAQPHFQRILDMPEPPQNAMQNVTAGSYRPTWGPPGINTRKFDLPQSLTWDIQGRSYGSRSGQQWVPKNFEEAQAGALVQLTTIAQQQRKLDALIKQFEADAEANPKNIKTLETLAQIYKLTENTDKVSEILDRLIAVSPNDPVYQSIRLSEAMLKDRSYETFKAYLDGITGLNAEARLWYIAQYASSFYRAGQKADAEKLAMELESATVTDLSTAARIVGALAQMDRTDAAEKILEQLPIPVLPKGPRTLTTGQPSLVQQQWSQYRSIYESLAAAYMREGETEKGIDLLWMFFARSKPNVTNARRVATLVSSSHSYSGYTPLQTSYPSPTIYYNQSRLQYLQQVFSQLLTKDELGVLYAKLQTELDTAIGRDRIYPGLALSYCYWWEGQRDKSQEVLSALQKEFPEDLTLKLNTVFAAVQTGQHAIVLDLLKEISAVDARNRRQYYDLTLQLAAHTGNTVTVRELVTKVLNSPSSARELHQFSEKLQQSGLTQYAIAIAKKAMTLAMGERDPNFLINMSRHLEQLGRGKDAARLAERALRFANQRDRYGRTLYSWHFQQASRMAGRSKAVREREPQLVAAVEKNPESFQAHAKLATFYESTNQLKKASEAFEAALSLRPKDSMTRQRYAQMLQRSGQAKAAVTQYTALLKDNPNALGYNYWEVIDTFVQSGKIDELVSLAKEMIAPSIGRNFGNDFAQTAASQCMDSNAKAAVEIYEQIIKVQPNQLYTYRDLASAYTAAGEPEKAIQLLREILETEDTKLSQDPYTQVEIVSKLIELYKTSGEIEVLVTEYETKLVEKPEDMTLLYLVASMRIAADDLEGSTTLVNQLLDKDTGTVNVRWLTNLADAYRGANDRERERHLLESAVEKMESRSTWGLSEIYQKLGAVYAQQDEKERAQKIFRKMGTLLLLQRGGSFYEKERIAGTYMQHEMWDDAEVLLTDILNDFSAQGWSRDQAQRQLMDLKRRRDGMVSTTVPPEETEQFNVGMQRTLAQQHARRGEVKKAIDIYEQIAKVMPEDLESRAQLAALYSRRNQHDKAIDIWEVLLEADPENTKYQDGLVDAYQDADKTTEAVALAQQYIETDPESSVNQSRLAKLYAANDQVDAAIDTYKKAIALGTGDGQAFLRLAQLHLRKDDLDAAEKAFEDAIQHTSQDWERQNIERQLMNLHRRQGKLEDMLNQAEAAGTLTLEMQKERAKNYRNAGEVDKAVNAYKKALEMTSQSWDRSEISNHLLKLYAQIGEDDLAMELYEKLSQSGSTGMSRMHGPSGVRIMLGGDEEREVLINVYKNQGKLDQLKTIFESKLEADTDNSAVLEMVAEIHRNAGNHGKAAEAYQALCEAQPSNVRGFYYAATAFHKSNQPDLAKEMLDKGANALSTNNRKQDSWFLTALASICIDGEFYDTAIKLGEDAIASSRSYGGHSSTEYLYEILGKSYLGAKQYERAVTAYRQMANTARYDEARQKAEMAIRRAYKEGDLYEKQIPNQLQKIEENPDNPDAHFALAETHEFSGNIDEAIAQYEKLSELQPDNTEWYKKIGALSQKSRQMDAAARLEKAITAYEKAIELDPTSYQFYSLLAGIYTKGDQLSEATTVYRRALDASLEEHEYNGALRGLWELYADKDQEDTGIAILEELKPKMPKSAVLLELLGDAYKEVDNTEKADAAYAEWLAIRQKEVNRNQRAWDYRRLADELLSKDIMPALALELAERALQMSGSSYYAATLAHAYVANDQYEAALEQFKHSLNDTDRYYAGANDMTREMWSNVAEAGKNAKDEKQYVEMVNQLKDATSDNAKKSAENTPIKNTAELHANVTLSRFYRERDLPEKAEAYMDKTGFIPENSWWIIGPFDNAAGIGYDTVYVPEDATQIEPAAQYDGIDGQVSWEKQADDTFDGFVNLGNIFEKNVNWNAIYAWTTVNSPDERKVELRFSSNSQAKLWLNGKQVFTHSDAHSIAMDQDTIPVTLKPDENSILVKICSEDAYFFAFYLRITDTDGNPFDDLIIGESEEN